MREEGEGGRRRRRSRVPISSWMRIDTPVSFSFVGWSLGCIFTVRHVFTLLSLRREFTREC